ncbi:putative glutamate--tRNA ligase, cytoplasmic [Rhodotorula toruloides]|nr:putative glutamate--tRNA ligase, cytoplasmic [Rhodotorula toruloides]
MASATTPILRLQAKSSPIPLGLCAFAYSLPPAQIQLEWVHSLPKEANGANCQVEINGKSVFGTVDCFKALGDAFAAQGALGKDNKESTEILSLLLLAPPFPPSFPTATSFLSTLEQRLTLRTYLTGSSHPTVADYHLWAAVKTNVIAIGLLPKALHTQRWFNHLSALPPCAKALVDVPAQSKVKPAPAADKKDEKKKEEKANATFELGLPGAQKGKVVTRLPPEPSGYLHIGHAKAAVLNQYFARMYDGKFLVRFDDTNPSKEKAEFEQSIVEDLALLGIKADATSYTSDYFDQLQQYAIQLIKDGKAYADDTEQEVMRDQRMNGVASARRDLSPEESLAKFAEMATGSDEGKRWCIRAKMSVDDPNKALRDPVIYRVNDLPHHRTGSKYKIYPTYDFACPVVDSIEGVTHALRTNEYRDRNPQYQWMLDAVGLRKVNVWDFGRLAFVYTLLSKRKLKWFVENGYVSGWDDPRFPTVRGIRRRGMTVEAITQFMLQQGPSQAFLNLEWDVIWNLNKKVIDPVAPRFVALEKENLVPVKIVGGEGKPAEGQVESKVVPKHKKNPEVGEKTTFYTDTIYVEQADAASFAQDEELTLMDWGNAFVRKISRSSDSGPVTSLEMELNLAGDFKKTKKKVTWLASPKAPSSPEDLTQVSLLDYDYLITKKKLEEDDNVEDLINPTTEYRTDAVADHNVASLAQGTIIQFERKGFYIVDRAFDASNPSQRVELILIPDGRASSVALKHQAPSAPAKDASKASKTPSKDKQAAMKAKKGAEAISLPELAPAEAVEVVLKSDGSRGYDIPVKTKMYKVDSPHGHEAYETPTTTSMYEMRPINE